MFWKLALLSFLTLYQETEVKATSMLQFKGKKVGVLGLYLTLYRQIKLGLFLGSMNSWNPFYYDVINTECHEIGHRIKASQTQKL